MISYWRKPKTIHIDDGLTLIMGWYDHKNENDGGDKALGIHWGDFPQSRGILSPCVVPPKTRNAILEGLLHHAVTNACEEQINLITEAIKFFNE